MLRFMHERGGGQKQDEDEDEYSSFDGKVIVVELSRIDGETEDFEGRAWLESKVKNCCSIGWDLEWQPDRNKDQDNPVALMQFADETTCLLIRTHLTKNWLPASVLRCLLSDTCKKVGVGWDGPDKLKMYNTFNFTPAGIVDLALKAKAKRIPEQGLKSLTRHFGMNMKKDSKIARSNWAAPELSPDQIRYAAEDAYFSFLLLEKIEAVAEPLPDEEKAGFDQCNQGILELKPGWEEQGVMRKHDGLWCTWCEKGPMTVPMILEKHLEGKQHRRKVEEKRGIFGVGVGPTLPEEYADQGIVLGDDINGVKAGVFKCMLCDAGPLNSMTHIESHCNSKKHQKAINAPTVVDGDIVQKDPFAAMMWNLPDYVKVQDGNTLVCTLCPAKATAVLPMCLHLGGDKHARRCRNTVQDEIIYIKEKSRLESMSSGLPVVRTGYTMPKNATDENTSASQKLAKKAQATAKLEGEGQAVPESALQPLPEGWEEHTDTLTGSKYFYDTRTGVSQWERPGAETKVRVTAEARAGSAAKAEVSEVPKVSTTVNTNLKPLPEGWVEHIDEASGSKYYYDSRTGVSQWERPGVEPKVRVAPESTKGPDAKPDVTEVPDANVNTNLKPLPEGWQEHIDAGSHSKYFYDTRTGVSQWERPGASAILEIVTNVTPNTEPAKPVPANGQRSTMDLPPGWQAVWHESDGRYYYADVETQSSQWEVPEPYVPSDWSRHVDASGRAYWIAAESNLSFYEDGSWHRIVDHNGRVYWSSSERNLRFFET